MTIACGRTSPHEKRLDRNLVGMEYDYSVIIVMFFCDPARAVEMFSRLLRPGPLAKHVFGNNCYGTIACGYWCDTRICAKSCSIDSLDSVRRDSFFPAVNAIQYELWIFLFCNCYVYTPFVLRTGWYLSF